MGANPFDTTKIWEIMFRTQQSTDQGGIAYMAMSAIDLALWDLKGKLLGRIRFPNHVSNMCWGEDDWKTLFITDHHRVYRTRVKVPGVAVW